MMNAETNNADPPITPSGAIGRTGRQFTLLDLMAIVAAFGLGFGLVATLLAEWPIRRIAAGAILGAIFGVPLVLLFRWRAGRLALPLRPGEQIGLMPLAGLLLPLAACLIGGVGGFGLFLFWGIYHLALGACSGISLAIRLNNRSDHGDVTWLEFYGYLLCILLLGVNYIMI